jgi:ribosome-associated toxin RatA of RatAB toxin-antitoxin module
MKTLDNASVLRRKTRCGMLVPASMADVFEACRDVTGWSRFMPAVREATFVTEPAWEGTETIRITAEANTELHTWCSARYVSVRDRVIRFVRLEPALPLVRMEGFWRFNPESDGTRVVLQHSFTVKNETAAVFFATACRRNAERDLAGLARLFGAPGTGPAESQQP